MTIGLENNTVLTKTWIYIDTRPQDTFWSPSQIFYVWYISPHDIMLANVIWIS